MSDTGYYPPDHGTEPGETCWRAGCRGRMVYEDPPHVCMPGEMCRCSSFPGSIYCGVCGADVDNEYW